MKPTLTNKQIDNNRIFLFLLILILFILGFHQNRVAGFLDRFGRGGDLTTSRRKVRALRTAPVT